MMNFFCQKKGDPKGGTWQDQAISIGKKAGNLENTTLEIGK